MARLADICLIVPSYETPRIQEVHITIGHILCDLVDFLLFPDKFEPVMTAGKKTGTTQSGRGLDLQPERPPQ